MREYASIEQLLVLANIESMNAELIRMGVPQAERLIRLNEIAVHQLKTLTTSSTMRALGGDTGEQ